MRWLLVATIVSSALAAAALIPVGCVGYLDADAGLVGDGGPDAVTAPGDETRPGGDGGVDGPATSSDGSACGSEYSCAVLSLSPLLYLRFNEPVGVEDKAIDSSGNGHDGKYPTAGAKRGVEGALIGESAGDTAVEFNGDLGITMPKAVDFDGPPQDVEFSIEFWIKPTALGGYRFVIDHETHAGVRAGWDVLLNEDSILLEFNEGNAFVVAPSPTGVIEVGKWHHVVFSYDGATRRTTLFVNNQVRYSGVHGSDASIQAIGEWTIGKQNCSPCLGSTFDGTIDELAIYPISLNGDVVAEHYTKSGR